MTEPPGPARRLQTRIESRAARVAIVGLGYVGLPLVRAVHEAGFGVIGFDIDEVKIEKLRGGEAYLRHMGADLPRMLAASDRFQPTSDPALLRDADIIVLCVPTPLGPHREPDLSFVRSSADMVGQVLRAGQLVSLESTTYPGTTREEIAPRLVSAAATRGLSFECGRDFFVAYSPEREDPGRAGATTSSIPKLVGGLDAPSHALAAAFYGACIERVHKVGSAEVAEAAKLLENIYRAVNIALVNELKVILDRMGIDVWEVIDAAKTKPFGFQAFYPGPGLGGHCIPIDPCYLTWKAEEVGHTTKFIELAGEINQTMPARVVMRVMEALNDDAKPLRGARTLVIGLAYKPDVDDIRESPAAEIIKILFEHGADVRYHDAHIPAFPTMRRYAFDLTSEPLTPEAVEAADCLVIVTNHSDIDYALIGEHARLIVDTRNAMAQVNGVRARVVKA